MSVILFRRPFRCRWVRPSRVSLQRQVVLQDLICMVSKNLQYISVNMQQLFLEVLNQFQSSSQYQKFVKQASREYDIKVYRLHMFTLQQASLIYRQLHQRYQANLIERVPCGWNQNERRLYVWFIVCYIRLKLLDCVKLVDNDKHWRHISHVFWGKDILFLKYQLHTIIKTRGRTVWSQEDDDLLKEIYWKHLKGEWNEIAKEFYFVTKGVTFKGPKQCRERWQNHLNAQISKADWTLEEDRILLRQVKSQGRKWARIIPLLKNTRTEHMIKNRFKAMLNKETQGKNIKQEDAINAILRKINQELGQKERTSVKIEDETKRHEKVQIQPNQIEFVQSEEIFESVQETKKPRGRPRKDTNELNKSMKFQPQSSLQRNHNLQKIGEFEGCVVLGPQMPQLHKYFLNSQRSNSLFGGQSNEFFRSSGPEAMFNSGHYSLNNSLRLSCEDKSFVPLEHFTIKQDRSGVFEKKKIENISLRSFDSIRMRHNQSFLSKFMNP